MSEHDKHTMIKHRFLTFVFLAALVPFLGFSGSAYADCAQLDASGPNPYANIHHDPFVIFSHPQLVQLPQVNVTNDMFMAAFKIQPCADSPWKDPILTYSAQLFCDLHAPNPPNPFFNVPLNTKPSREQLAAQNAYEETSSATTLVYSDCMHYVYRRVACPNPNTAGYSNSVSNTGGTQSATSTVSSGNSACFTAQNIQCHLLKDQLSAAASAANASAADAAGAPSSQSTGGISSSAATGGGSSGTGGAQATSNYGFYINHTGVPEIDGAIRDCDTYGFSEEAYDAAIAHRCGDPNYLQKLAGDYGDGAEYEQAVAKCLQEGIDYDNKVLEQKESLVKEILLYKLTTK